MRAFIKPALIVTCFAPRSAENSESAHPYVGALWTACRALGMTSPIVGLPEPEPVLPQVPDQAQEFTMLTAATRDSADEIYSAFAFAEHDVTGLVALLAPNDTQTDLGQWSDLLNEWTTALTAAGPLPSPHGILHEFRIFEALLGGFRGGRRSLCDQIRRCAPSGGSGPWWEGFDETNEGFRVWRAEEYDSLKMVSDLYVLAPARLESALDAWAWTVPAHQGLRPLTRYLMNAARVNHARRLYASSDPLQPRIDQSDRETTALLQTLEPAASGAPVPLDRVQRAADLLDRTQFFGPHGLLWTITQQRQLTRTVSIAIDNMRLNTPAVRRRGPGHTWPDTDLAAAEALIRQMESDQVHLEATRERADAARSVASAITERVLTERRNQLTLIQTSVLGAVITALTAVQAFNYKLPVSRALQSPLILLLAALALALPLAVLRSAGGAAVSTSYRWLDSCAAGLVGTTAGWTAVAAWGVRSGHGTVPMVVTLPCAGVAGLLTYGAYHFLVRRRSRSR